MPTVRKAQSFSLYRLQFVEEATSFPTSKNLPELAFFVKTVLEHSAASDSFKSGNRRWVITLPRLFKRGQRSLLYGEIAFLKVRPVKSYDYAKLTFTTQRARDAEIFNFALDGDREFFAIRTVSGYRDATVLHRFQQIFLLAGERIRHGRTIVFHPITHETEDLDFLEKENIRRFIAHLRRPNADLKGRFKKIIMPTKST